MNIFSDPDLPAAMLAELRKLNREGVVNDEEFLVLRRLLTEPRLSGRTVEKFERLFAPRAGTHRAAPEND